MKIDLSGTTNPLAKEMADMFGVTSRTTRRGGGRTTPKSDTPSAIPPPRPKDECPNCKKKMVELPHLQDWICNICGYSWRIEDKLNVSEYPIYTARKAPLVDQHGAIISLPLYNLQTATPRSISEQIMENIFKNCGWYRVPGTEWLLVDTDNWFQYQSIDEATNSVSYGPELYALEYLELIPIEKRRVSKYDGFFVEGDIEPVSDESMESAVNENEVETVPSTRVVFRDSTSAGTSTRNLFDMVMGKKGNITTSTEEPVEEPKEEEPPKSDEPPKSGLDEMSNLL